MTWRHSKYKADDDRAAALLAGVWFGGFALLIVGAFVGGFVLGRLTGG